MPRAVGMPTKNKQAFLGCRQECELLPAAAPSENRLAFLSYTWNYLIIQKTHS